MVFWEIWYIIESAPYRWIDHPGFSFLFNDTSQVVTSLQTGEKGVGKEGLKVSGGVIVNTQGLEGSIIYQAEEFH